MNKCQGVLAMLLLLVTASTIGAQVTLPKVAGTSFVLQGEAVEGDESKTLVPMSITYHVGLLDDDAKTPGAMAKLAALVFETAGKRGSANWQGELLALDALDALESKVATLQAKEKRSAQEAAELKKLVVELSDMRVGTDFLGVGAPLNNLYFAAQGSGASFKVGPEWVRFSFNLPREALALFCSIEGERRSYVPLRKFSASHETASDLATYAIQTPGIELGTMAERYLRSGGSYAPMVQARYSYEANAAYDRQMLRTLWARTFQKAHCTVGIGVDSLTEKEALVLKTLAREEKTSAKRAVATAKDWSIRTISLNGEADHYRWHALRGKSAPSREAARRLDAWLSDNFDKADKGLSHTIRWLPDETLIGFRLKREGLQDTSVEDGLTELRSPVKAALLELASAKLWEMEMKNARLSLAELTRYRRSTKKDVDTGPTLAKALSGSGAIEISWREPAKKGDAKVDDAARAKAIGEIIKGVKDEKRQAELKRLLEKLKAKK